MIDLITMIIISKIQYNFIPLLAEMNHHKIKDQKIPNITKIFIITTMNFHLKNH